jgi:hypothetical protein
MATEMFGPQVGPTPLPIFHSYADAAREGFVETEVSEPARFDRRRLRT